MKRNASVVSDDQKHNGSTMRERLTDLIGKRVQVRVWWSAEAKEASPDGDLFVAVLRDCIPIGRDYYFVFELQGSRPRRTMIKTAAVLQVTENEP